MCDPVTAMVALTAVSTGLGVYGQQQMAKQQMESLEDSARLQNETIREQYRQIEQKGTEDVSQVTRTAMIEQARMRVAAGESGIAGNTVDAVMGGAQFNAAEAVAGIGKNTRNTLNQAGLEAKANYARLQSQANSIKQPDWIGAGLQIAGSYFGAKAMAAPSGGGGTTSSDLSFNGESWGGTAADPWYG